MKVKLGEVADQIRGVTYKSQDVEETLSNNSIPLLRANNISNNGIINYDDVIFVKKNKVNTVQLIQKNDILVCASSGSVHLVGKAAQIKEDKLLSFGAFCKVIRPKNINALYLGYFFQSPYYRNTISSLAQGANINNIRNDDIDNLMINIYDDVATQEIVSILDKVTSLIKMRNKQLEKLDILVKSKFIEMFGDPVLNPKGWEKKKLGEVYTIISGTTPDTNEQKYWNGTNLWVTPAELNNEIYINTTARKITDEAIKAKSLKVIPKFSVLLSSRAPIGKLAINTADMYCNQGFKCFINSKVLHSIYTYFYLLHRVEYIQSLGRGATFKEVSKEIVANIEIQAPPLDLQNQFAEFVEQVEKNKEKIKSSLNQLETLYSALMQEYFG